METGGAERVAVNLANALAPKIESSFLCTTRKEGVLKSTLISDVGYLFLNKKKTFDFKALKRLNIFVQKHQIIIIHAHSSSFFLAFMLKLINSKLKIIWHDHYGRSEYLNNRKSMALRFCSRYFSHILSVNKALEQWSIKKMKTNYVSYFPNFPNLDNIRPQTKLLGINGKRIIHLANLRPQKDHQNLLNAFSEIVKDNPDWTLHCVGKDFKDAYSFEIKQLMKKLHLEKSVFFYDSKSDIKNILSQCDIGVLSSKSEGLPLALLEYGLAKLPSIATNVGDCNQVISSENEGQLIEACNIEVLIQALNNYVNDIDLRNIVKNNFEQKVLKCFSEEILIDKLIEIYNLHLL